MNPCWNLGNDCNDAVMLGHELCTHAHWHSRQHNCERIMLTFCTNHSGTVIATATPRLSTCSRNVDRHCNVRSTCDEDILARKCLPSVSGRHKRKKKSILRAILLLLTGRGTTYIKSVSLPMNKTKKKKKNWAKMNPKNLKRKRYDFAAVYNKQHTTV